MNHSLRKRWHTVLAGILACAAMLGAGGVEAQELKDFEKIKESGVMKVAVYNNLAPYSDKGKGIDVDIAAAIATKLGLSLKVLPFNEDDSLTDDLRNMVWKGHYLGYGPADLLMHAPIDDYLMNKEDKVLFFGAYVRDDIFVARNLKALPELSSLEAFSKPGNRIGAEVASLSSLVLAGADSRAYAGNLVNFKNPSEAVDALLKGELVAVMGTRAELEGALFNKPNADQFGVSKVPHNSLPRQGWVAGMATKAGNQEFAKKVTSVLDDMRSNGEMARIFEKYGVRYTRP